ncbi:hypothetical protein [Streptomyces sp. NPDC002588]|uniref:hypothetical protein n=1 Tax=Streptomyces sp. NPDC002588 TaxID=3154419 RepID=UPI00332F0A25
MTPLNIIMIAANNVHPDIAVPERVVVLDIPVPCVAIPASFGCDTSGFHPATTRGDRQIRIKWKQHSG